MLGNILSNFYKAVTPPVLPDEESARTACILPRLCLGLAIGAILVIFHNILGGRWRPIPPVVIGLAAVVFVTVINRLGWVRAAALTLVLAFLTTITLLLYTAGQGIRDISALFLPVTLVVAGLLLSRRDYILVVVLTLLCAASVIISERLGLLVGRFSYFTTWRTLLDVMIILSITALVIGFLTRALHKALGEARRHQAALQESQTMLSGILNSVPQAIFWKDRNGVYLGCNEVFARTVGLDNPEAVVGKIDSDLPWPMEDTQAYRADDREVLATGRPKRHIIQPLRRADNAMLWIDITKIPLLDVYGKPAGILGVYEDITDRKQAEEEVRRLNEELEQRIVDRTARLESVNKELEAFGYSVSHDLRAPLRRIDGFTHAIAEDWQDRLDDQAREYLTLVRKEVRRMAQLIEDLLNLSRISRSDLYRRTIDLSTLARDIIADLRAAEPDRQIEVTLPERLTVQADEKLMRIVLENLLGNAWKFTRRRDPAVIELGAIHQDGQTVYFVRDNGAGFDMAYAGKLFAPFQRLHTEREFEGTGVGLATVQRIVARHGGRAWAHGVVNQGATVYFTL